VRTEWVGRGDGTADTLSAVPTVDWEWRNGREAVTS
jgi:hypothetical protein